MVADEVDDDRLAGGAGGGHQACGDLGRGRLGDDHDHARGGVAAEQVERLEGGDGADRFGQVAAAGAEGVGDAAAQLVDAGGDELEAGARGADHADGAAAHGVGKAEADAVDDGGAAVGAHHEQAAFGGGALEGDLVFEAHVVAVEKDVAAEVETLAGDAGGKAAGTETSSQRASGAMLAAVSMLRGRKSLVWLALRASRASTWARAASAAAASAARTAMMRSSAAGGLGVGRQQVALGEDVLVGGGAHDDAGVFDPGEGDEPALQLHEDNRIVIGSGSYLHVNHGLPCTVLWSMALVICGVRMGGILTVQGNGCQCASMRELRFV